MTRSERDINSLWGISSRHRWQRNGWWRLARVLLSSLRQYVIINAKGISLYLTKRPRLRTGGNSGSEYDAERRNWEGTNEVYNSMSPGERTYPFARTTILHFWVFLIVVSGVKEMTSFSQSPRDRILWILMNNGGKMERSRLRAATGMRYALLNPILEELAKEGRIRIATGKQVVYLYRVVEHENRSKRPCLPDGTFRGQSSTITSSFAIHVIRERSVNSMKVDYPRLVVRSTTDW